MINEKRKEVLEMWLDVMTGGHRMNWDERAEFDRLKNYASDDEIEELYEELERELARR